MKSFSATYNKYLYKFLSFPNDWLFIITRTFYFLVSAVAVFLLLILYKKIRKKFPIRVNCWFCNSYCKVPFELSNCWDCPNCLQYNGFNEDGGYNKIIPEQYNSRLNEDIFNNLKSFSNSSQQYSKYNLQTNGFCKLCNINQQLKIQQLALFVPLEEKNYFEEVKEFREKLEKAYQLCSKCEITLLKTLKKQKYDLLQNNLNNCKQKNSFQKDQNITKFNIKTVLFKFKRIGFKGLRCISLILAILLFTALLCEFETEKNVLYLILSDVIILKSLLQYFKIFWSSTNHIYMYRKELSLAGFICSLLGLSDQHGSSKLVSLSIWGILHILLWSKFTEFQILLSGVLIFYNSQAFYKKHIYLNKVELPNKSTFKKVIFPESNNFFTDKTGVISDQIESSQNINFESSLESFEFKKIKNIKKAKGNLIKLSQNKKINKKKKTENEIKIPQNEKKEEKPPKQKKKDMLTLSDYSVKFNSIHLNSASLNNSFLSTLEENKNEEANESLNEVYNNFNDLNLGGELKKTSKPLNFLFASNNFSEKKNSTSVIKPAKFVKNLSSYWSSTESNETVSRSSTPISGYSSQKMEKFDSKRYDFVKTGSSVSFNNFGRHSTRDYLDYYGGKNSFYNNFNCFSPGFASFQQYPNPIGHTAIYTYARPTSYPFPWQVFSTPKFSPPSPRFSEVSEYENIFQNTSKSFENSRKWCKLKKISYYFSIFLNVITIVGLVYFVSTGIVSVKWRLPKLNFFV